MHIGRIKCFGIEFSRGNVNCTGKLPKVDALRAIEAAGFIRETRVYYLRFGPKLTTNSEIYSINLSADGVANKSSVLL